MKKTPQNTISSILVGDTLAKLVERLNIDINDPGARMIVILLGDGDIIRVVRSEGISKAEALGTLYLVVDKMAIDRE